MNDDEGYLVVDDFCNEIEEVRESAIAAGISTWLPKQGMVGTSVYEGMGFWGYHAKMLVPLMGAVRKVVVPNSMFFRLTNEGTEEAYIHSDRTTGNHTCIVYLSKHEDGTSGTAFYRHKKTGLIRMPSFEQQIEEGTFEMFKDDMESRDLDRWEQIGFVEGKYNRALIFEAPLFHSRFPFHGIGKDSTDGRLIWATHFYKLDGDGTLS